ncbi:hypothetical protein F4809DRAFT_643254 [Biscogniauxia mediterranea]|nr:hypothetical protein F4809DRAFT_643254 [Biscogniauxia mediterranea]
MRPRGETWNTVMGDLADSTDPDPNSELYIYKYTDPSLPDTQSLVHIEAVGLRPELRTLGIEFHKPTSTLLVTKHRCQGPRIEQFRLNLETLMATNLRSLSRPLIHPPNSPSPSVTACGILVVSVIRDREKGVGIVAGFYATELLVWQD